MYDLVYDLFDPEIQMPNQKPNMLIMKFLSQLNGRFSDERLSTFEFGRNLKEINSMIKELGLKEGIIQELSIFAFKDGISIFDKDFDVSNRHFRKQSLKVWLKFLYDKIADYIGSNPEITRHTTRLNSLTELDIGTDS